MYEELISHLTINIFLHPNVSNNYFIRAEAYFEIQDYNSALKDYLKAYELGEENEDILYLIGLTFDRLNDKPNASIYYTLCLNENPSHCLARNNLGLIFYNIGKIDEAEKCYLEVIKIDKTHFRSRNNLGILYGAKGEYGNAIKILSEAISIKNDYDKAYVNRGHAFIEILEFDLALQDLNFVIEKINPYNDEAYYFRGKVFVEKKKYEEAFNDFKTATNINPNNPNVYIDVGKLALDLGMDHDIVLQIFEKAIETNDIYALIVNDILEAHEKTKNDNRPEFKSSLENDYYSLYKLTEDLQYYIKNVIESFVLCESEDEIKNMISNFGGKMLRDLSDHGFFKIIIENSYPIEDRLQKNLKFLNNNTN